MNNLEASLGAYPLHNESRTMISLPLFSLYFGLGDMIPSKYPRFKVTLISLWSPMNQSDRTTSLEMKGLIPGADLGRCHDIGARRALLRTRRHRYPIMVDRHKFMVAVPGVEVTHDRNEGTAPYAMKWEKGGIQYRSSSIRIIVDDAYCQVHLAFWAALGRWHVLVSHHSGGCLCLGLQCQHPSRVHYFVWPLFTGFGEIGVSHLEPIMFEQSTGTDHFVKKLFGPIFGLVHPVQALFLPPPLSLLPTLQWLCNETRVPVVHLAVFLVACFAWSPASQVPTLPCSSIGW